MSTENTIERIHEQDDETDSSANPIDFDGLVDTRLRAENDEEAGSHVETDPKVFHPSSVGYTKWKLLVTKLGIERMDSDLLRIFEMGNMVHEFIEDTVAETLPEVDEDRIEVPIEHEEDGLVFTGHADLYDPEQDIVYDFKSRGGWYNFDPPNDRHLDQLHVYMAALDADYGQVIYVNKKNLEIRPWPEGAPFTFDDERWRDIKLRCMDVRNNLELRGLPTCEEEIPFERPDNFYCNSTDLDFSNISWGDD